MLQLRSSWFDKSGDSSKIAVFFLREQAPVIESRATPVLDDNVEIVETDEEGTDAFAAYFAEAHKASDREVRQVMQMYGSCNRGWSGLNGSRASYSPRSSASAPSRSIKIGYCTRSCRCCRSSQNVCTFFSFFFALVEIHISWWPLSQLSAPRLTRPAIARSNKCGKEGAGQV